MIYILFILETMALSVFLWLRCLAPGFPGIGFLGQVLGALLLCVLLGLLLSAAVRLYVRRLNIRYSVSVSTLTRSVILTLSPLLLLSLTLLYFFFFLNDVRPYMMPFSLAGIVFLQAIFLFRLNSSQREKKSSIDAVSISKRPRINRSQASFFVFLIPLIVYILLASGLVFPAHPITGDEPHYLIITESLLNDGDINLFNNYEDRDYLRFYPGLMDSHAYNGKKGAAYQYSRHLPGLAVLMIPACALCDAAGIEDSRLLIFIVRLSMCLFTALLSWVFFLTVRYLVKTQRTALISWLVFSFSPPVVFYSSLIYPEIPAGLIFLILLRLLILKEKASPAAYLTAGICGAVLPWLGVKYVALSVLAAVVFGVPLFKSFKKNSAKIAAFFSPLLISAMFMFYYLWFLYGNFSPFSIYTGASADRAAGLPEAFTPKIIQVIQAFLGYLFDQRIGIFVYAPIYILVIAGIFISVRKRWRPAFPLLFILLSYWLFCSLFPYWSGFCPPGRQLLVVIPAAALFLALFFSENRSGFGNVVITIASAISAYAVYSGVRNPWILYHRDLSLPHYSQGEFGNLVSSLSGVFIDLRQAVPLLVGKADIQWFPLLFWILIIGLITWIVLKTSKFKREPLSFDRLRVPAALVSIFSVLCLTGMFLHVRLDKKASFENKGYELFFQDDHNYGEELDGFWTKGNQKTEVLIRSPFPLAEISLTFSSPVAGRTKYRVDRVEGKIFRNAGSGYRGTVSAKMPTGFYGKGSFFYTARIEEYSDFVPSQIDHESRDDRSLGVFVEIGVRPTLPSDR